jgi:hypothetical protein
MGESYMDGDYEVDDLGKLLAVATANAANIQASPCPRPCCRGPARCQDRAPPFLAAQLHLAGPGLAPPRIAQRCLCPSGACLAGRE